MEATATSTFTLQSDGAGIIVDRVAPASALAGVVLIVHGMAEHAARYARFAGELAERGYAVYAPDQRGHGRTPPDAAHLGWAGRDGWNGMLRDLDALAAHAREQHPGAPLFVLGHSMGSVLAQRFAQLHGAGLRGLILSGSFGAARNIGAAIAAAGAIALIRGARVSSPLQRPMFAGFNAAFGGPTGFEWLSRDSAAVRAYVDDPRCGFTFSNGLLLDMLRGYVETWQPRNERALPRELPVLLFSGALDPVGRQTAAVTLLAQRYRALGLRDVSTLFYPEGRHEMLNETNRSDVVRDVLSWLDAHAR